MTVGPTVTRYELELGPGREGRPGHGAAQGHRLRPGRHGRAHPGPHPRALGHRRRGAQQPAPPRGARRPPVVARGQGGHPPARGRHRQGHRRPGGDDEPGHHAPPAHRRGHRRGQVERAQLHHHVDPHALHARPGAPDPHRPEAGRDGPVQPAAPPAHPARHQPQEGGQRAVVGGEGDGAPLRPAGRGRLPRRHRLQHRLRPRRPPARAGQRPRVRAPAVHRRRGRRAERPHDGGGPRRRGLDHPHRPDGPRRRHPPHRRHPAARA